MLAVALLSGRVSDRTTGQPLPGVRVSAAGATALTDGAGRYRLRLPHAGSVTLTLQSADVPVERMPLRLKAGANVRDVRACSTTLDYGCGAVPAGGAG